MKSDNFSMITTQRGNKGIISKDHHFGLKRKNKNKFNEQHVIEKRKQWPMKIVWSKQIKEYLDDVFYLSGSQKRWRILFYRYI